MKILLAILLIASMALAPASGFGEVRYDCRMSGEKNQMVCCCAGGKCCAAVVGSCCHLEDSEDNEGESSDEEPCGCCDIRIVASGEPFAVPPVAATLETPGAALLPIRIEFVFGNNPRLSAGSVRLPGRSPPVAVEAPLRVRFCSFLI